MAVCVSCQQPLEVEIDDSDSEDETMAGSSSAEPQKHTVPDDVHLNCGCHFHWECLLDAYSVSECPNCSKHLLTTSHDGRQHLFCNLNTDGELQENYDILDVLTEEAYLKAYPEERKCRAFLEFCKQGDVAAIVEMIKGGETDEDEAEEPVQEGKLIDIFRYQDPMGDEAGQSGLHKAVVGGSREVAWMLLLLASTLDYSQFPALVMQEAASVGLMREEQEGKADIRSLTDAQGQTAEQLAASLGGVWHGWPGTGRLAI